MFVGFGRGVQRRCEVGSHAADQICSKEVYLIIEEGIHNKTFSKNMGQSSPIRCKRATQVKLFNSQPRPINI